MGMFMYCKLETSEVLRNVGDPRTWPYNPKKFVSLGCILLKSRDGPVQDAGNGSSRERDSFLLVQVFFYGPGLNFDSSEIIYITCINHAPTKMKEMLTN